MIKKYTLAGLAGVAGAALAAGSPAVAADLSMPTKAPIMAPAPDFSWSGCYVGGHVGWGWGKAKSSDGATSSPVIDLSGLGRTAGVDTSGAIFGGQLGCNYQFSSNWVIGVEGSIAGADINGRDVSPFSFGQTTLQTKTDWLASATARLGYTWGQTLLYVKGGGAWAHSKSTLELSGYSNSSVDQTRSGWTVGAGLEWAFGSNWSTFVEYDHYFFNSKSANVNFPVNPFFSFNAPINFKQDIDTVKIGVNYRFGGGSVVAKY
jgi:outer membrane immunogenic protein